MLVDILPGEMAEEQLHRDQHRRHPQAPVQHDLRLGAMDVAEHVPRAGGGDAHRRGQQRREQHVRPARIITDPSTISRQSPRE